MVFHVMQLVSQMFTFLKKGVLDTIFIQTVQVEECVM